MCIKIDKIILDVIKVGTLRVIIKIKYLLSFYRNTKLNL